MPLAMAILSGGVRTARARAGARHFQRRHRVRADHRPAIGGFITEKFGWRWIFWINLPIGLIAIILIFARLRESFGPKAALDIPGLLLVAVAALALVWSLLRGNPVGWTSPEVISTLALGLVFAIAFVAWELRASAPMVPMRLFASRSFAAGVAASLLFYAAMYGVLFLLPQFLQGCTRIWPARRRARGCRPVDGRRRSATAPIAGGGGQKFGELGPAGGDGIVDAGGGARPDPRWSGVRRRYPATVGALLWRGIGRVDGDAGGENAVSSSVAVTEMGKASGVVNMGRFLGGMFGIALLVTVFSASRRCGYARRIFPRSSPAAMSVAR